MDGREDLDPLAPAMSPRTQARGRLVRWPGLGEGRQVACRRSAWCRVESRGRDVDAQVWLPPVTAAGDEPGGRSSEVLGVLPDEAWRRIGARKAAVPQPVVVSDES